MVTCFAPNGAALQEKLQQCGEEQAELAAVRWQLGQLQQVYTVTEGLLNQTRDDLDRVAGEVEGLRDANGEPAAGAAASRRLSSWMCVGSGQSTSPAQH